MNTGEEMKAALLERLEESFVTLEKLPNSAEKKRLGELGVLFREFIEEARPAFFLEMKEADV